LRCSSPLEIALDGMACVRRTERCSDTSRVQDCELPNIAHIVHVCARV
jgi:hypothetical protein